MEAGTLLVQAEPAPARATVPSPRVEDFERIEEYLRVYLDQERFTSRYPRAQQRWSQVWAMLWRANSTDKVVAVADQACEVMSEFVAALADLHEPHPLDPIRKPTLVDRAGTLQRLVAVIETYRPALGDNRCALLHTLLDYWQALSDSVQRHREHRAGRMLGRLTWEDGRRVVVLTAMVMVEVDRSL
jgi:hypothetical protein